MVKNKLIRLALVPALGLSCSAYVFQSKAYRFTAYTSEVVYKAPFHFYFDFWSISDSIIVREYTYLTYRVRNGIKIVECEIHEGGPYETLFTATKGGEHFKLDLESTCGAFSGAGNLFVIDFVAQFQSGGSGFSLQFHGEKEDGGGLAYHTKASPYLFPSGGEYHPHRTSYDFARSQLPNANYSYDYYYRASEFKSAGNQVLTPFNITLQKIRTETGAVTECAASKIVLRIKSHLWEFQQSADRINVNTGDVEFDLVSTYSQGYLSFSLKRARYVDVGTGKMKTSQENPLRDAKTNCVVLPMEGKESSTVYDCELSFELDKDHFMIKTSQINLHNGVGGQGNRYHVEIGGYR